MSATSVIALADIPDLTVRSSATTQVRINAVVNSTRMQHPWIWLALFFLGCYHGVNPGMGWLFAVALGLQDKSARSVFGAIPPIALGHIGSVTALVLIAGAAAREVPQNDLRFGAALVLLVFGIFRLTRARHIRWVGMRVGFGGLALWAFLMATGHGAGLMLLPFLTGSMTHNAGAMHMVGMATTSEGIPALPPSEWAWAVFVHTFGYLVTMTAIAWIVYDHTGVSILKSTWFNFDLVWAIALIVSAALIFIL